MIPIPKNLLNCAAYIYKSKPDADAGARSGGSVFFVGVELEVNKEYKYFYGVTARHVLKGMDNPVFRINLDSGGCDSFITNRNRWLGLDNSYGDDLAVYPIGPEFEETAFKISYVPMETFLSEEAMINFFPGDEVFMVGRFISYEGTQQNTPSARFGNISMMPIEPLSFEGEQAHEAFLVEQRSLPGYSGSPVFVCIDRTQPRPPLWLSPVNHPYDPRRHGPFLLGVDSFHIHDYEPLLKDSEVDYGKKEMADPKRWVRAHSGMAGVIPAWRLANLLNSPEALTLRQEADEIATQLKRKTNTI